ncbi:MAG TPA: FeoA family protein [bacterium]|uniref:FeoA domain protein n=1 Tax=candidate division TA06 bacterium ADurb.Bin417 TaxID=1852828 RepID=A0A1V5MH02_UNCT6|nr:MAG: FeoA domain protein [candidate division TA06 bacterium ADurb.Bin417]HNQ34782.1 FeoA family protein [bacterium]HNS48378.1 FeoA family protein [bacterium]
MKCSFCGLEFDPKSAPSPCQRCPVSRWCGRRRCPGCGMEIAETGSETGTGARRRRFGKGWCWGGPAASRIQTTKPAGAGEAVLTELERNRPAEVSSLRVHDRSRLEKLMALGILPGLKITLLQKFPAYIVQVGNSQFALDEGLAACIFVKPLTED